MGWFGTYCTSRKRLVKRLSDGGDWGNGARLIDSASRGNVFYAVIEKTNEDASTNRFIWVARMRGCGSRGDGWAYKPMSECDRPDFVDCPLRLLDLAGDVAPSPAAEQWRSEVRAYHESQRVRRATIRGLSPGDTLVLRATCTPSRLTLVSNGRGGLVGRSGYMDYRVAPRHLDLEATAAANAAS